ncbi:hypothetical protein NLJ89_g10977 [Agrocybe chaxingu]|uniref:Uncharacterized protein n=1 Tax=Agrocybe chaxingu TaxID=84603 RepID=A0A9W8MQE3_9AGAR|nr:hypothetical protein NLJ89_g10977 [Agrocybe chaxingu]
MHYIEVDSEASTSTRTLSTLQRLVPRLFPSSPPLSSDRLNDVGILFPSFYRTAESPFPFRHRTPATSTSLKTPSPCPNEQTHYREYLAVHHAPLTPYPQTYLPTLPCRLRRSHVEKYTPLCPSGFPVLRVEGFERLSLKADPLARVHVRSYAISPPPRSWRDHDYGPRHAPEYDTIVFETFRISHRDLCRDEHVPPPLSTPVECSTNEFRLAKQTTAHGRLFYTLAGEFISLRPGT